MTKVDIFGRPSTLPEIPEFDMTKPISYSGASKRVLRWRGRPSAYNCAFCFEDAEVWSYLRRSKHEQTGPMPKAGKNAIQTIRWSPDPMDYIPLCRECRHERSKVLASAERG